MENIVSKDTQAQIYGLLGYIKAMHDYNPDLYTEWASLQSLTFLFALKGDSQVEVENTRQLVLSNLRQLYREGKIDFKQDGEYQYFKMKESCSV